MESGFIAKASLSSVRVSARKARLVADMVRGKRVERALDVLGTCDKKVAPIMRKLLMSAVHNAKQLSDVDVDQLYIKGAIVNEGATLKRFMPRAQGRATPIRKRTSCIELYLDEGRGKNR